MQRSQLLKVTVHCPHFQRPVAATRNQMTDRLCDCDEKHSCRAPASRAASEHDRPFPHGCPVFPSLSR